MTLLSQHYDPVGDRLWMETKLDDSSILHLGFTRQNDIDRAYLEHDGFKFKLAKKGDKWFAIKKPKGLSVVFMNNVIKILEGKE